MVPPFLFFICFMKNILYLIPLFLLISCFESPKTTEEIAQNDKLTEFVQDRARRDTVLSYNNIYLGMSEEDFHKTKYYSNSIDDHDTIIDNNNTAHEVYVIAGCDHVDYDFSKPSVLDHIELSYYSFSAEKFNALRDLYISKYGPFSLYHTCPNKVDYNFYTIDKNNFYTDLLSQGDFDIKKFEHFKRPLIVDYIWCWANCYIRLFQNSDGVSIWYQLHHKNSKGEIESVYFDFILPQKPKTISDEEKERIKKSQSI